jgi:hypothetical protein
VNVTKRVEPQKPFLLSLLSNIGKLFTEVEIDETEIPEVPLPLNAPAMPHASTSELIMVAAKSFLQGIWQPKRVIAPSIAVNPAFPIRCFSWHPYLAKFAVAPQDGTVRIYDLNSGTWSSVVLQHEYQTKIFGLAWKPLSGNSLAVATMHGVLVWNVVSKVVTVANQPHSAVSVAAQRLSTRPPETPLQAAGLKTTMTSYTSVKEAWKSLGLDGEGANNTKRVDLGAWCNFYHHFGHSPVNAIAWSPGGRYLAVGSIQNSQMLIWDCLTEMVTPIVQFVPGNINKLIWSPNDEYICAVSGSNTFRVYNTKNWASQRWTNLSHPLHSACWSGDGSHLAFTVKGEAKLYIVRYTSEDNEVHGELVQIIDMSPYLLESSLLGPNDENSFGGTLSYVAWDPTSSRLAVGLEETELIALFQCNSLSYSPSFQPLGYLRGPPDTLLCGLYFRPHFPKGGLLTATFSNGKISFFPLYFRPSVIM